MSVLAVFTLSNSSDAFLVLKAAATPGLFGLGGTPFVLVCLLALNASQALLAVPVGRLSDRVGRKWLIVSGWLIYVIAYAGFAFTSEPIILLGLFLLYGAFYGFTDGVERALIADLVDAKQGRGFAYGVFNFVVGVMIFPASLLFGWVAARYGATTGFIADAVLAACATVGLASLL
jgi:MFS family permease